MIYLISAFNINLSYISWNLYNSNNNIVRDTPKIDWRPTVWETLYVSRYIALNRHFMPQKFPHPPPPFPSTRRSLYRTFRWPRAFTVPAAATIPFLHVCAWFMHTHEWRMVLLCFSTSAVVRELSEKRASEQRPKRVMPSKSTTSEDKRDRPKSRVRNEFSISLAQHLLYYCNIYIFQW